MAAGIQIDGLLYALNHPQTGRPIPVRAWTDTDGPRVPEFKPGDGYNHSRRRVLTQGQSVPLIDTAVWHWTGGEAGPDVMAETLRKRKLGVEFAIGRTGEVWQFCDPGQVDTADAGVLNYRSLGVEIVCYGYRSWREPLRGTRPRLGNDRELYEATTHGRTVKTARFYECQVQSALALAALFSRVLPIPCDVCTLDTLVGDLKMLRGHVGHYQISLDKRDPGPWFMERLREHMWYVQTGEEITRVALPSPGFLFPNRRA